MRGMQRSGMDRKVFGIITPASKIESKRTCSEKVRVKPHGRWPSKGSWLWLPGGGGDGDGGGGSCRDAPAAAACARLLSDRTGPTSAFTCCSGCVVDVAVLLALSCSCGPPSSLRPLLLRGSLESGPCMPGGCEKGGPGSDQWFVVYALRAWLAAGWALRRSNDNGTVCTC